MVEETPAIKNMLSRRSIREYKDEQIKDEELELILKAGTYAPSGRGLQSAKIMVIQDKEIIEKFSKWNALYLPGNPDVDPFFGAPTLLIVLANSEVPTYVEDGSVVIANMLNAAHSLGIGSCWVHRARNEFESEQGKELLKVWGIPET